jgi:hypothetical protein
MPPGTMIAEKDDEGNAGFTKIHQSLKGRVL